MQKYTRTCNKHPREACLGTVLIKRRCLTCKGITIIKIRRFFYRQGGLFIGTAACTVWDYCHMSNDKSTSSWDTWCQCSGLYALKFHLVLEIDINYVIRMPYHHMFLNRSFDSYSLLSARARCWTNSGVIGDRRCHNEKTHVTSLWWCLSC